MSIVLMGGKIFISTILVNSINMFLFWQSKFKLHANVTGNVNSMRATDWSGQSNIHDAFCFGWKICV